MKVQVFKASDLGAVVRSARKAQGMTQNDLAGITGTGRRFISDLERGKETAQIGKVLLTLSTLGIAIYTSNTWDNK